MMKADEQFSEPALVTLTPQPIAVLHETVSMTGLPEFFGRAFGSVMGSLQRRGKTPAGAPLGLYHRMPTDTVEVSAGFPTADQLPEDGEVRSETLPGGLAVKYTHAGDYSTMTQSYDKVMKWMTEHGHTPGPIMWEHYLTEPKPGGKPEDTLTLIVWPIV